MTTCHLHGVAQRRVVGTLSVASGAGLIGIFALVAGMVPCANAYPTSQYVRTESGKVRCDVQPGTVGCQASGLGSTGFLQAPITLPESQCRYSPCPGGIHSDLAEVTASGAFHWSDGNLATGGSANPQNDLILNYGQSYDVQGWTILPNSDGTRFTNDGTGHGMFASIENVAPF